MRIHLHYLKRSAEKEEEEAVQKITIRFIFIYFYFGAYVGAKLGQRYVY
jgi:hypothetical protein